MAYMNPSATNFLGSKIKEVVSRVESEYKVEVVAVTANASESSRRGRQMLCATRPDILSVDCAADCISGLMADYFKVGLGGVKAHLMLKFREFREFRGLSVSWFGF